MKPIATLDFKLGILQCDSVNPDLQIAFGDYPEMFRNLFEDVSPALQYAVYDLTRLRFPASLNECDAWLLTGSKWSVYDHEPWIHRARQLTRNLHRAGRPLIGICFGHQLVAQALGGKVVKSDKGWGVGNHTANIVEERRWMTTGPRNLRLLVSHQDQVIELPKGARRIAGHDFCPNDIVQIGTTTLTFQGHPEFSAGYSKALMERRRETLGEHTFTAGIQSLREPPDRKVAAEWILTFLAEALEKNR